MMRSGWISPLLMLCLCAKLYAQAPAEEEVKFFEQKIRPVLVQHCYSCHSVAAREQKKLQADLYLDSAAGLLAGGESGPAIVKGKSAESLLLKALKYDGFEMPPSGKLSAEIVADFARWIDNGAADPRQDGTVVKSKREINIEEGKQWWSFQPLAAVTPPAAPSGARIQTPIDQFIQAALAQQKLTPNGPASKAKLLRRAYFDLIGLPPTPEQIDAFAKDESPQAFEKVIDELLASQHYGEKWARHWLDVARYAESGGYEFDGFRGGAYHYRDWVIRALNEDLPYNQFVRQQLAGDKLQPEEYAAASASGFLVAGPYPGQITAKTVERIRYDQLDDMLMTVGGSMLGLTIGCVRCHDHKYDPIPQTDYYALAAALAKTGHGSRTIDPDPAASERALEAHRVAHEPLVADLRKFATEQLPPRVEKWRKAELAKQPEAPRWQTMEPVAWDAERSWLKSVPGGILAHDGLMVAGVNVPKRGQGRKVGAAESYSLTYHTHQKNVMSLRLDAFTEKSLPQKGPGLNTDGSFQLGEMKVTAKPLDPQSKDAPLVLKLKPVFAAFEDKDQPIAQAVDGKPNTAWVVKTNAKKDNAAVFELETPLAGFAGGTELQVEMKFKDLGIGRLRLALSTEANPATWAGDLTPQHVGEIRAILAANGNKLPDAQREEMTRWFAPFDTDTAKAVEIVRNHTAAEPRPKLAEVYTTVAGGQDVFLLRRGEVENKLGKAEPGFIQVLRRTSDVPSADTTPVSTSAADPRIALADWMTDVEQGAGPLLARVMANRLWQHHFGQGLVGTPNDFGAQGERPSHPELLEWLASELVNNGWKLKPLHKQIMLSAVYQQANEVSPENLKIDPANRFWWHYQPRRLDAELIRDSLLAIGGNLDKQMFGPSILDNTPRRSIYLRVKRSELIPLMTMFDAPEPTQSIGERISTTVPTQSLAMMNSPFVRDQAEKLAKRIKPAAGEPLTKSIDLAYQISFARLPTETERSRLMAFLEQQQAVVGADPAAAEKSLTEFCQVLLCLSEFVYID
ncbi:PSD1 and planctomycete cytochrome C domain-containing protein [Anatilimnocola sp. NA78]|uniref:PSD1 and planctomycete cytochrome C domain-containing protein n=1 Tax=Anatilimnocola sp. NA78 TaxID=3415683 RepID=UPI003CE50EEB